MKRLPPILVCIAVVVVGSLGCWFYVKHQVNQGIDVQVVSARVQLGDDPEQLSGLLLLGLEVQNQTPLSGTYQGVDGTLKLGSQLLKWTVEGIEVGQEVSGGEELELTLHVPVSAKQAFGGVLGAVITGKLEMSFEGHVKVSMLGLNVQVPVSDRRSVSIPKPPL